MRILLWAAALVVGFGATAAHARVTKLEITSRQPYGSFRAGDYVRLDGRVTGELAPGDTGIPDLEKAAGNARGTVEYSARVILFVPTNPASGNGALLLGVPNRGNAYASPGHPHSVGRATPVRHAHAVLRRSGALFSTC